MELLTSMTGTGDALSLSRAWYLSSSAPGKSSEKKSSRHAAAFVRKFFVIILLERKRPCLMRNLYSQMPKGEERPESATTPQLPTYQAGCNGFGES